MLITGFQTCNEHGMSGGPKLVYIGSVHMGPISHLHHPSTSHLSRPGTLPIHLLALCHCQPTQLLIPLTLLICLDFHTQICLSITHLSIHLPTCLSIAWIYIFLDTSMYAPPARLCPKEGIVPSYGYPPTHCLTPLDTHFHPMAPSTQPSTMHIHQPNGHSVGSRDVAHSIA